MTESDSSGAETAAGTQELVLRIVLPATGALPAAGEATLEPCLASLVEQNEPGWELGRHWEIVVVAVGEIPTEPAVVGVRRVNAGAVPGNWTERTFACSVGSRPSGWCEATWLLFTEADSLFAPGSVSRSIVEANRYGAGLLSYGPSRNFASFGERAVLPLVLSEIANAYPVARVNDSERRLAFADEHFLLLRADAYDQVGGYAAVAASSVPEVDLAFLAKRRKIRMRYRHAPDAVAAAPAVSFDAVWRRWTPVLAVLIDNSLVLAVWRLLDILLVLGLPLLALHYAWYPVAELGFLLLWARTLWRIYRRARKSNVLGAAAALSILGLPVFVAMLLVSWYRQRLGTGP